jgi:hypothetical protein
MWNSGRKCKNKIRIFELSYSNIVLYCIVLYCIVLYCIVLYWTTGDHR